MKELISKEDVSKALKLEKLKLKVLTPALMKLLKLDEINEVYGSSSDKNGIDFIDNLLEEFHIKYELAESDILNIPKTEPFILIANHPYGGIDGIILTSIISKIRPDFKFVANYLLNQIPQISSNIIPVNPFENIGTKGMNVAGVKQVLEHIKTAPLGIFPAGEVSALKLNNFKISDKKWEPGVGKIIAKAKVKVLPVYFSGHNSLAFNLLGLLHPGLRTIKLPSEMLNKGDNHVKIRIGKAIPYKEIATLEDDQLLEYLRAKTYALGANEEKPKKIKLNFKLPNLDTPKKIIAPVQEEKLEKEIKSISTKSLLYTYNELEVYVADASQIPFVLKEISRLREITFREIGEGTNQSSDTDEFDLLYKHLFIWDKQNKKLVGSYRLGEGDVLFQKLGAKGFYLNQLFKMKKEFYPILFQSLELGRSFVALEYQKKPMSLMLLCKGIHIFLQQNTTRFQYLIGPVSITNNFSSQSKDLLVAYIRHNHWDNKLAKLIKPKKAFHYKSKLEGKHILRLKHSTDLKLLDSFIGDIEGHQKLKVPVLVKKYLKINGKIISFNVDPKFNDSLDGFLVVEVKDIPNDAFDLVNR
ncbi:MAG: lysophospholipid acyltransferase family protein [Bacteroidia bacterium]|nr:lysophospholipid acyltransferase family protein [Bacteroidia bacterium]